MTTKYKWRVTCHPITGLGLTARVVGTYRWKWIAELVALFVIFTNPDSPIRITIDEL